ncbi:chorismate mutase [Methanimicrococcus blatticola]|uniref:Chorismate mutase n=1 Tax=Methanimicrococcus blatticola TaxID=91560 RepID=A0A484F5S3_9EURY|nr:chorismate mutase [Methanimicrococcus blatticola]MCC2509063.1 chorismate mutase [Methanimicrococcus blatticola]TDQ68376.1 chorismate mutase [Methanimicrococcus blatticola]
MPTGMLETTREKMRLIDREIIDLIEVRTNLAGEILSSKKEMGKPIVDEEQIQNVLDRASSLAVEKGLDVDSVHQIFDILIQMSIDKQNEYSGKSKYI